MSLSGELALKLTGPPFDRILCLSGLQQPPQQPNNQTEVAPLDAQVQNPSLSVD